MNSYIAFPPLGVSSFFLFFLIDIDFMTELKSNNNNNVNLEFNLDLDKDRLLCVLSGTSNLNKNKKIKSNVLVGKLMYYNKAIELNNLLDELSKNNINKVRIIIISKDITPIFHKSDNVLIWKIDYQNFLSLINYIRICLIKFYCYYLILVYKLRINLTNFS